MVLMIQTLTDQLSLSLKLIMYFVSAENLVWKQNRFSFQSRHQWVFISEKYANLISNNYGVHSAHSTGGKRYIYRLCAPHKSKFKTEFPKLITHV